MLQYFESFIESKVPGAKPMLIVIRGSRAYGTNLPESDTDYAGVYIQSQDDILGSNYIPQIADVKNDIVFYEIKRFVELLSSNNPTVLELLNTPDDRVIFKHYSFNNLLNIKDKFITKVCASSFGGYGTQQIKKAKGLDKKQNWEDDKMTKKDLLDFCFVIRDEKAIPWKKWNSAPTRQYEEKYIGAVKIPNSPGMYAFFYDRKAFLCFSQSLSNTQRNKAKKEYKKEIVGNTVLGYRGLINQDEEGNESNSLRLSSIPKGEKPFVLISYNQNGYSSHCTEFKSYQEWLKNRNENRYVDVKEHGQKIDGKNMMHCVRLLDMAMEIAQGKGVIVRRPNRDYLLSIRKGKVDLSTLITNAESYIKKIDELFDKSNLPKSVDKKLAHQVLIDIRKSFYN